MVEYLTNAERRSIRDGKQVRLARRGPRDGWKDKHANAPVAFTQSHPHLRGRRDDRAICARTKTRPRSCIEDPYTTPGLFLLSASRFVWSGEKQKLVDRRSDAFVGQSAMSN
jgi:hypothetical protein